MIRFANSTNLGIFLHLNAPMAKKASKHSPKSSPKERPPSPRPTVIATAASPSRPAVLPFGAGAAVFAVRTSLKVRAGAELDSDHSGEVRAGTRVHILEQRLLADSTSRTRLVLEGERTALGWVSTVSKTDGQSNLLEAPAAAPSKVFLAHAPASEAPHAKQTSSAAARPPLPPPPMPPPPVPPAPSADAAATSKPKLGARASTTPCLKLTHAQPSNSTASQRGDPGSHRPVNVNTVHGASGALVVAPIDTKRAAADERRRAALRMIDWSMSESAAVNRNKILLTLPPPTGSESNRAAVTERQVAAKKLGDLAVRLENALREGLDTGVPDAVLERGMMRIADLEQEAAEQRRAAEAAAATRAALAATQTKSTAGGFREGCLVKLHGLTDSIGLQQGAFDVPMAKYNGRMGRVVEYAPSWLMKAGADGPAGESLVAVLLAPHATDRDRANGVWIAVPPANLQRCE